METLQDLVLSLEHKPGIAKSWKEDGRIRSFPFTEYHDRIQRLSQGFRDLGVRTGGHVMHVGENNKDWMAISLALNSIGAVDVPVNAKFTDEELAYVARHSDAETLIVNNEETYERMAPLLPPAIKEIVTLDDSKATPFTQLMDNGTIEDPPPIDKDALASIIYTSGTTGNRKGVMLTHLNLVSNFTTVVEEQRLRPDHRYHLFLPPEHILERGLEYCLLHVGAEGYHTTPKDFIKDLVIVRPNKMAIAPLIAEMIYTNTQRMINAKINKMPRMTRGVMRKALPVLGKRTIRKGIQEKLGGNLDEMFIGGGPFPKYLDDFLWNIGIQPREGYGMTETSPVITARRPGETRKARYTVGHPLQNTKIKIVDPGSYEELLPSTHQALAARAFQEMPIRAYGEVHVSGPGVTIGYYKDPEATNEALYLDAQGDKWLRTGDRGRLDKEGRLNLGGRYKELIIGTNGENIDPVSLEDRFKRHVLVEHTMVVQPQGSKGLVALITANEEAVKEYCAENGIPYTTHEEALERPEVRSAYDRLHQSYNSTTKSTPHHRIHAIKVLKDRFNDGVELANKKLKRSVIYEKYRHVIDELTKKD